MSLDPIAFDRVHVMPKILIIDGHQERLDAVKQALNAAHYEVALATSTSFALTMLEWDRPNLIVAHEELPDIDGYALCSIIRNDPKTKDLSFLLLTGPAGPEPGAATRAGVDMVLGGDFSPSDVVASVRRLLDRVGPLGTVLVVDDSLGVRTALALALETHHLRVLSAGLEREAIERIERDQPDLVVCDVQLPDGDGYRVCEFAKTRPGSRRIPVILMSGVAEELARPRARVRPDDVVHKPFLPDELASKIERLLAREVKGGATVSVPTPSAVDKTTAARPDTDAIGTPRTVSRK
jgi:CheY-like chemotaxis protein